MGEKAVTGQIQTHAPLPHNPYSDERINWIKAKVESCLESEFLQSKQIITVLSRPPQNNDEISGISDPFEECLLRNDRHNLQFLLDYLEDLHHSSSSALMFWFENTHERKEVKIITNSVLVAAEETTEPVTTSQQEMEGWLLSLTLSLFTEII